MKLITLPRDGNKLINKIKYEKCKINIHGTTKWYLVLTWEIN